MEAYSTWLIIKSMQIKTQGGITSPWSEWPSSDRSTNNKCFRSWRQKGIFLHSWWGFNGCSHCGKQHSVQFSSVTQSCPTPCDPIYCSTSGLPVHHQLLEPTQTHVHWVSDATQPSHPLPSPSPPTFNLSQHQSFPMSQFFTSCGQSIGASASVLTMNTQDWFPLGWTGWISLQSKGLSRVFSNTTIQKHQMFGAQLSL